MERGTDCYIDPSSSLGHSSTSSASWQDTHWGRGSYPPVEMQSVYTPAPAEETDWERESGKFTLTAQLDDMRLYIYIYI